MTDEGIDVFKAVAVLPLLVDVELLLPVHPD